MCVGKTSCMWSYTQTVHHRFLLCWEADPQDSGHVLPLSRMVPEEGQYVNHIDWLTDFIPLNPQSQSIILVSQVVLLLSSEKQFQKQPPLNPRRN